MLAVTTAVGIQECSAYVVAGVRCGVQKSVASHTLSFARRPCGASERARVRSQRKRAAAALCRHVGE